MPPLPCWQPRHPSPRTPAAQQRTGCFRSVASAARPPCWPVSHSLSGPRRCPRSMTPGTAAAPAPGCWLRCRISMRSGTAAERLLQPEATKSYETKLKAASVRDLILRITALQLYAIASNCRVALGNTRITPVMRITGHAGQRRQAAKGYELQRQSCCSCPQRSGPQPLHAAAAARAGLRSVVGDISVRSCCTLLQQHGPGKAGRRPRAPRRPRPPAHPAQAAAKPGLSAWLPCCCSIEKALPGDKAGGALLLPASTSRTKTAMRR